MTKSQRFAALLFVGTLSAPAAHAQETCMLVPLPLAERARGAALVVEARVAGQQAVAGARGNIYTINQLDVYKVFDGVLPAGSLRLAEPGGTLGLRRDEVTGTAELTTGQQGVFFLEPDPSAPEAGTFRLVAGPQGFVRYDAARHSAAEPFAKYRSIENELYPAVERGTGKKLRRLKANASLETTLTVTANATSASANSTAAAPVIGGLAPTTLPAGTNAVLTISGSGFGIRGANSKVEFLNADQGGQSYVQASDTDIESWTDTQIQVRVPSRTASGGAGTGPVRVTNNDAQLATSSGPLTVIYSYSTIGTPAVRARLINDDGRGGYTLQYDADFAANTAAKAAFERALSTWKSTTRLNFTVGATTDVSTIAGDGVNIVRFASGTELPANVLGRATSRYNGCIINGVTYYHVTEMDLAFSNTANWNFAEASPAFAQYDFQSVAVHEQGHAHQLGHIIRPGAVMHYAIANGQVSRTLSPESDAAAGLAVMDFSLNSPNPCQLSLPQLLSIGAPLPVELISFAARYEAGLPGTRLSWATAQEVRSAYFAVHAADNPADPNGWEEVARVNAAGQSTARRNYEATDRRPLAAGQVRYYRLRQVDTDGPEHFSQAVPVTGGAAASELLAYPNPATDLLHVRGPVADPATEVRVSLVDAAGRLVRELRLPAAASSVEVPVNDLRDGVYILQWQGGAGATLRQRILVRH